MLLIPLLLFITECKTQEALSNPRCNLQLDPGSCFQFDVNWYYDRYDHRCRRFYYGGCEGNENRFKTLEECSSACHYEAPTNRDRCFQPHDPGHCHNDIERWYFDKDKQQCVCSWWSGCGGNSNLYFSYNHCMFVCGEYAKHGPGIDEKYWGKRNRTSMSSASAAAIAHSQVPDATRPQTYPGYQYGQTYQEIGRQVSQQDIRAQQQQQQQQVHFVYDQTERGYDQTQQAHEHTQRGYEHTQQGYGQTQQAHDHTQRGYEQTQQGYGQTQQAHDHTQRGYEETQRGYEQTQRGYDQTQRGYEQTQRNYDKTQQAYDQTQRGYEQTQRGFDQAQQGYDRTKQAYENIQQSYDQTQRGYQQSEQGYEQTQSAQTTYQRPTYDYEELKRLHEDYYRRYPTTPSSYQQSQVHVSGYENNRNGSSSSKYAEFRESTSLISSSQLRSHPYSSNGHRADQNRRRFNYFAPPRARGDRIYRYDTGPITTTHLNGTTTTNRQVIYFTQSKQPSMTVRQRLPNLIEFTHITPPTPLSTMIPPRHGIKKSNKKKKTPPRVIKPQSTATPSSKNANHFDRERLLQKTKQKSNYSKTKASPTSTAHENGRSRYTPSSNTNGSLSTSYPSTSFHRNKLPVQRPTQHPLISPSSETTVKPTTVNVERIRSIAPTPTIRSTTPTPTIRVQASRIDDVPRPVIIEVTSRTPDLHEVHNINTKNYEDDEYVYYDEYYDDNDHLEHTTSMTSTSTTDAPLAISHIRPTSTFTPIVLPPVGYINTTSNEKRIITKAEHQKLQQNNKIESKVALPTTRSWSVEGGKPSGHKYREINDNRVLKSSTTQVTFGDDYMEKVDFDIQPAGEFVN